MLASSDKTKLWHLFEFHGTWERDSTFPHFPLRLIVSRRHTEYNRMIYYMQIFGVKRTAM
jgi:hypothetical protein